LQLFAFVITVVEIWYIYNENVLFISIYNVIF